MITACLSLAIRVSPPARDNTFRVVSSVRSLDRTNPPGRETAPRTYTMPACGTVTTSPALSTMLLRMSPVSNSSFKLIVKVFDGEGAEAAAFCDCSVATGKTLLLSPACSGALVAELASVVDGEDAPAAAPGGVCSTMGVGSVTST